MNPQFWEVSSRWAENRLASPAYLWRCLPGSFEMGSLIVPSVLRNRPDRRPQQARRMVAAYTTGVLNLTLRCAFEQSKS